MPILEIVFYYFIIFGIVMLLTFGLALLVGKLLHIRDKEHGS